MRENTVWCVSCACTRAIEFESHDRAWHSSGRLLSDAPVYLCVAGEDCYPTRVPGEAAGTSPTRDDRALTTYKKVGSTSARRSELQRVHTCPSPDTALLRSETQHLYGSNGVERLGLTCQGHSRLLPPHDAWRPDDWAVRDEADPTGTGKGYTVMLQPTGGQQVLAAKHTSSSAENKKLMGSETSEIPRRSSNPGPRAAGRGLVAFGYLASMKSNMATLVNYIAAAFQKL